MLARVRVPLILASRIAHLAPRVSPHRVIRDSHRGALARCRTMLADAGWEPDKSVRREKCGVSASRCVPFRFVPAFRFLRFPFSSSFLDGLSFAESTPPSAERCSTHEEDPVFARRVALRTPLYRFVDAPRARRHQSVEQARGQMRRRMIPRVCVRGHMSGTVFGVSHDR
jgi:hypothetical protein